MGAFSPIAAQSRKGAKPDSVVLMVGSCAQGLPPCTHADLLYSFTPIDRSAQLPCIACLSSYIFVVQSIQRPACCERVLV